MKNIIFKMIILSFISFFNFGCDSISKVEEVARISSPDNLVDAILYRASGGGILGNVAYSLFIVKKGEEKPDKRRNDVLLLADHLENLKFTWKPDRMLEISYDEARIFKFSNFWQSSDVQNYQYVIELKLVPNKEGHSLSKVDRFLEGFDMAGRPIKPERCDSIEDTLADTIDHF